MITDVIFTIQGQGQLKISRSRLEYRQKILYVGLHATYVLYTAVLIRALLNM